MGKAKDVNPDMLDTSKKPKRILHDLTGKRFGRLNVIEYYGISAKKQIYWLCNCDCGSQVYVKTTDLTGNRKKSCGCLQQETGSSNYKYGCRTNRLYCIWRGMKARCLNINSKSYSEYGERGISICKEWLNDFASFQSWALNNGYAKNLTIDRIDANGNYEPSNCRWANMKTQQNNKRNNRYLVIDGETKTLAEWCRIYKADREKVKYRLKKYSAKEALERSIG